jgi:hypothetical protein
MARRRRRGLRRLAIITVAIPVVAWALEALARRTELRRPASPWTGRLRRSSDFLGGFGRGPLARRGRR